jgi:hypothetical protein
MALWAILVMSKALAAQPQIKRTWLRQGGTQRDLPILVTVKATPGAKTPSRLLPCSAKKHLEQV